MLKVFSSQLQIFSRKDVSQFIKKSPTRMQLVQPLWKTVWRFLKKLKIELPYDSGIILLGIYSKNMKTLIQKICTPMFIA